MSGQRPERRRSRGAPAMLRTSALCATVLALASCGSLPRSGPLASELDAGPAEDALEGLVVFVNVSIAQRVNRAQARGFSPALLAADAIDPDRLGVGDEIDVLVWEPGGGSIFGAISTADNPEGPPTGAAALGSVRVDDRGRIFVPFLGEVPAAGLTPAELRRRIRDGLAPLSAAPEVDVRIRAAESRSVTVQGAVAKPGAFVLERGFTRLTPVLALAGGSPGLPEQTEVSVRRGSAIGAEMLEDVYANPALDIALHPGDVIVLNPIRERFIALGATTGQGEVVFPTRELTLLSALGAAAGLRDIDADPAGVFVLRLEDRMIADTLLPGPAPAEMVEVFLGASRRPVVYRFDLSDAAGLFAARSFLMRNGDILFSSNAPLTELRKILQIFTSVLTPVQQSSVIVAP